MDGKMILKPIPTAWANSDKGGNKNGNILRQMKKIQFATSLNNLEDTGL